VKVFFENTVNVLTFGGGLQVARPVSNALPIKRYMFHEDSYHLIM